MFHVGNVGRHSALFKVSTWAVTTQTGGIRLGWAGLNTDTGTNVPAPLIRGGHWHWCYTRSAGCVLTLLLGYWLLHMLIILCQWFLYKGHCHMILTNAWDQSEVWLCWCVAWSSIIFSWMLIWYGLTIKSSCQMKIKWRCCEISLEKLQCPSHLVSPFSHN